MNLLPKSIQNVLAFYKDPIAFLQSKSDQKITRFRMAHLPFYHITGLEEIKQVMVYEQRKFIKTPQAQYFTALALGEGLVSTDGDEWVKRRKAANPVFTSAVVDGLLATMNEEAETFFRAKNSQPSTICLNDLMLDIALRMICKLTFGAFETKWHQKIEASMETMIVETYKRVIAPVNVPLFLPTASNTRFNRSRKQYDQAVKGMTHFFAKNSPENSLLSKYLAGNKKPSNEELEDLAVALKTIIAAGHETTATTLTWLVYEIHRNPQEAEKLKTELKNINLAELKSMQDLLSQTAHTQQVINETMRLYPPIWLMGRMVNEEVEIGDRIMKKKDNVLISPFVMHRHEAFWNEPNVFKSSRFENKKLSFSESAFFPFGLGPRQCIGGHLAMMEMLIILANLYQRFEVKLINQEKANYHPYITLRPATASMVELYPNEIELGNRLNLLY